MPIESITNKTHSHTTLIFILSFGVFSILSTELGAMGLIPIFQTYFNVSASEAGWAVSIFALMITLCAPIVPLLCAGFNQKKLMLLCLAIFSLTSLLAIFVSSFWQLLVLRGIMGVFHPIYIYRHSPYYRCKVFLKPKRRTKRSS